MSRRRGELWHVQSNQYGKRGEVDFQEGAESLQMRSSIVFKKVIEATVFMAIGAALFAANPRVGWRGGLYLYSCTAVQLDWVYSGLKPPINLF